jgi:nicotinate-nucleotide adenylyltransferase
MTADRRVGILGGTLDPVHRGHLDAAAAAQRALRLDEVLFLPSSVPPHRAHPVASSYHRFAMVALAISGRAGWRGCDLELADPAPSYTADTLRKLHERGLRAHELFFITGADAFTEIATWKDYPAVLDLAHFAVVSRRGMAASTMRERLPVLASRMRFPADTGKQQALIFLIDAPTADVSSTAIRRACAAGESIADMVPDGVRQHIAQHALYDALSPARNDGQRMTAGGLHGQD